ncbi:MAG: EAL domain-containing response regulator [Burkholderiales bacterium]|jgi:EAL domain-containing protein (putative c-di-GMP-specific phosphodiesterase class I)|nr:EAL domain-containing response regulator [Burkholderiales bacterium]
MDIRSLRLLVIEDQTVQRQVAVGMLRSLGVSSIDEADDGYQALDALRTTPEPPDVIVCDLRMPGMDGIEFIRHLGDSKSASSIILASALDPTLVSSVEAMARAQGLAVLGTLPKPLSRDRLGELLARFERPELLAPNSGRPRASATELEEAIADGQIVAYFQPKLHVTDGAIAGAEALARWHHPHRGVVGPGEFIPLAEQCGLIDALTWVMLEQSMEELNTWRRAGQDWAVSVNLSLPYLEYNGAADRIAGLAERYGIDPQSVVLEVTESLASANLAPVLGNVARLRMKGFGVAIDDYGTGYSSLKQLAAFPFTELKVDQSFVQGASVNRQREAILASSVELARRLQMISVAEGVETQSDLSVLETLGCDLVQGFLFARPMAAGDFAAWAEI